MKILITGSSGFIGTELVDYLSCNNDMDLLCIDKVEPKIQAHNKYFRKQDILDYINFSNIVSQYSPDYIIHLAARTDLKGKSINDYESNTIGVYNLMLVANKLPNLKKIIVTSSMLVCQSGYKPKDAFDYSPTTIYGYSKVETEKIVWANQPSCDWAILRPTSIWGPSFDVPYRNFFDLVQKRKYFHIGNKSCTKTYGYVGNSIYQIMNILFSDTRSLDEKVFYIGDNPPINIETWANEISSELGSTIIRIPFVLIKTAAKFGDLLSIFNISFPMTSFRLKNMTTDNIVDLSLTYKYAPNPPFTRTEGIKKTLLWLNNN